MERLCGLCAVREDVTCVGGRNALGEHGVRDDVEHTERKHHGEDVEAELEHAHDVNLQTDTGARDASLDYYSQRSTEISWITAQCRNR